MLECSLCICLLLRIFTIICKFTRFKNFSKYIKLSLIKILPYFIFLVIILLFFSIFAQILFGPLNHTYVDYPSSFFSTLLFSIGHFQKNIINPFTTHVNYQVVFTFLFFIIIVYFQLYSYFGIYIETYRINSLKHGNCFDIRMMRRLRKEDDAFAKSLTQKKESNILSEENKTLKTQS